MNELQVVNMRTSSPVTRESLLDKVINAVVDGAALTALAGGLLTIGAMYGYLLAVLLM